MRINLVNRPPLRYHFRRQETWRDRVQHVEIMVDQSTELHRRAAGRAGPIRVAVVTVSDSRTLETDVNGSYLRGRIEEAGHTVVEAEIVRDDPVGIEAALERAVSAGACVILFNGGTGIAARDNTFDVIAGRLEKIIPGFGELFRMISWEQVGAAAMLSRAVAGVYRGTVVFCMPGSPAAVRLAWEKLIAPELEHVAWELGR